MANFRGYESRDVRDFTIKTKEVLSIKRKKLVYAFFHDDVHSYEILIENFKRNTKFFARRVA